MATQKNAILRLRRDNDFNYAKVADKFIPANGEVCLVDTARNGLQAKIGDGVTPFGELTYVSSNIEVLIRGYYLDGAFYEDKNKYYPIDGVFGKLYLDLITYKIYFYEENSFIEINSYARAATPTAAGIMKLYHTTGSNTDGTMTQKAITDELNEKFEITLRPDEELIIFTND